jgi:hypothetical protein
LRYWQHSPQHYNLEKGKCCKHQQQTRSACSRTVGYGTGEGIHRCSASGLKYFLSSLMSIRTTFPVINQHIFFHFDSFETGKKTDEVEEQEEPNGWGL